MEYLILTEHKYPIDEVIVSLIQSILNKSNINEAMYWFFELFYSVDDFKAISALYTIYLLYFSCNISLHKYILKKINKYNSTKDLKFLCDIVNNLFKSKHTGEAFILMQNYDYPNKKYNDSVSSNTELIQYKNQPKYMCELLNLIENKDCRGAGIQLYKLINIKNKKIKMIYKHLTNHFKLPKIEYNTYYSIDDVFHIIALINRYLNNDITQKLFIVCDKYLYNELESYFNDEENLNKQRYDIHDSVYYNVYIRDKSDAEIIHKHWEYCVYESKLWKKRIDSHDGYFNESNKLKFKTVKDKKKFYKKYDILDKKTGENKLKLDYDLEIIEDPNKWYSQFPN